MAPTDFALPTLETARKRLAALFTAYGEATGYPVTLIGRIARGDPKCVTAFEARDFLHGSYDTVVARLSALWPEGVEWPADVPRLAPAEIDPATLKLIADRHEKARAPRPPVEGLPAGADWPNDIPKPAGAAGSPEEAHG